MSSLRPSAPGAFVAVLVTSLSLVASAQSQPASEGERLERARQLYDNGALLYEEGRYEAAILAFEEAYALSDAPLLLYNIANAYERLGDLEQAVEYLDRYRAYAPPEEAESVGQRVRNLERRIDAQRSGERPVETTGEPADEHPRSPSELQPATHDRALDPAHWALGATALAGLTTGLTFGLLARGQRHDFETSCQDVSGRSLCPEGSGDVYDTWRRDAILSDVGFATAGGAVIALILYVVLSDDGPAESRVSIAPWFSTPAAGLTVSGSL